MNTFGWRDLEGRSILLPSGPPSPDVFLLGSLRGVGVDVASLKVVRGLALPEAVRLFRAGFGDFLLVDPLEAHRLRQQYGFQIIEALASLGSVPWSVYYAATAVVENRRATLIEFREGLVDALKWVLTDEPLECRRVLRGHFPGVDTEVAFAAVQDCRSRGFWQQSIGISPSALSRWQTMLVDQGLLNGIVAFEDIVTNAA
jgi:ABC-type nitrate/sulfonate/bicarbonate transport system substrate-binding protein